MKNLREKNIFLPKADAVIGAELQTVIINISEKIPKDANLEYYKKKAELFVNSLINILPQAMIEPIIIKLLEEKISRYRGKM